MGSARQHATKAKIKELGQVSKDFLAKRLWILSRHPLNLIHLNCLRFFLDSRFKSSSSGLLLATDVAARGLDIPAVEHVLHYQVPKDPDVCSNFPVGVGWGPM